MRWQEHSVPLVQASGHVLCSFTLQQGTSTRRRLPDHPSSPPHARLQRPLGGRGAPPLPARAALLCNQHALQLPRQPRISIHAGPPPPARPLRWRRLLPLPLGLTRARCGRLRPLLCLLCPLRLLAGLLDRCMLS